MLLNNFLYTSSLNKNEQYHFRTSFKSLIPKTTIYDNLKNPFKDEVYQEKIKTIHIGGRTRGERRLNSSLEECKEENESLKEENEELEEKKEELEKEKTKTKLRNKIDKIEGIKDENKELKEDKERLEEENEELEEKNEELEEENEELEEENEGLEEENEGLEEEKEKGKEKIEHEFNNRKINFDNITKDGGGSSDKDIKNVIVSFF